MTPLDLETLDPSEINPALYYALCREAVERGIPVSLDNPDTPTCVEDLIARVARHREDHALVEAIRDAVASVGITAPDWVEEIGPDCRWESWEGVHVALDMRIEDTGNGESGPCISASPTRWANICRDQGDRWALQFVDATDDSDPHGNPKTAVVYADAETETEVAAILVSILRTVGYSS